MSEFEIMERRRRNVEEKKQAAKDGAPVPGSLKEFMARLNRQLEENPILKEFIFKQQKEFKETLATVKDMYCQLLEENNVGVQTKIEDLITAVNKLDHNFTFYANQMLSLTKEKNQRIYKTLTVLDAELKLG